MISKNHKLISKIKDGVFLVTYNNVKYVMKRHRSVSDISIVRSLRNKKAFKTELNLIMSLKSNTYFRIPKLIETDYRTYYILTYFEVFEKESIFDISIVKSILKFNTENGSLDNFHSYVNTFLMTFISLTKTLSSIGLRNYLKIVANISLNGINIKKREPILLHGDLRRSFNLRYEEDVVYFIDFESIYKEKKYLLYDIINFSNDVTRGVFYKANVSYFIKLYNLHDDKIDISEEVRIAYLCLLRSLLVNLNSFDTDTKHVVEWIIKYFVDFNFFTKWYSENIDLLVY